MPLIQTFLRQLGSGKEAGGSWGVPVVATAFWPFQQSSPPKFRDIPVSIFDPGGRGVRAADQGYYQGVLSGVGAFETMYFPGLGPHALVGIMGQDTISGPAAKTGTLGVLATTGLTTATYTLVGGAAPLTGETYMIDSGLITEEAVLLSSVSGGGPYTINFTTTPTKFTHLAAAPAASMWTHAITMASLPPSYTFSDWYNGPNELQYAGMYYEKVSLNWVANAEFKVSASLVGKSSVTTTQPSASYTTNLPVLPWSGLLTLSGVSNPRLETFSMDLSSPVVLQQGADGTQQPNAGTVGQLTVAGKMTFAMFDDTERLYFLNNTQPAAKLVLTAGAKSLTIQMSKCAFVDPGEMDTGSNYALFSATYRGIYNTTDAGPCKFLEVDGVSTAF